MPERAVTTLSLLTANNPGEIPKTVVQRHNPALIELVEGVAHDLNNNVAIVLGNVQLIKLKNKDEAVVEGLNRIEKSIVRCSDLIKAIQHYAGNNTGLTEKIVNFAEALGTALEFDETNWKEDAAEKKLTIYTSIESTDCLVGGDMQELVTALSHLIHNAVDASSAGGTIRVKLSVQEQLAVMTIADEGHGIDENIKLKIYEPFFSTKESKGAGLGLTIVQSIVSRYGGRINFQSNNPSGTIFSVSFPLKGPAVKNDNHGPESDDDKTVHRILIVDDDPEIRNVLSEMLSLEGYRPEHCPDAYCAMELLEKSAYDMVITDLGMPGMSGYDLAEYVNDKYKNIQLVLLTGWGDSINKSGRKLKGIKAVLAKPFRLNQILELVRN